MSFQPGDRFGRYELAELLGKGGMGEVYRAHDTLLHRRVALKVLRPAPIGSVDGPNPTDGAARILREARAAAGIAHPNAIAIYDVGEVDGVPFLAMEFIAGRTLRAFIGDESITIARRARWLVDVARALGAAHQLGLVHRDIKPENIMVGDDGIVKVLDFGIARRTTAKATPDTPTIGSAPLGTLTADGVVVGTPFYMAPEQMRGEPLDGRADQFAWGVVAYELLTGDLPWQREAGGLQVVAQILSREVDPPRSRNGEIPSGVDAALRMALSKSASGRFASMEELADEIESHAAPPGGVTGRSDRRRSIPVRSDIAMAPTQSAAPSGEEPRKEPRNEPSTRTQLATQPAHEHPKVASRIGWRTIAAACVVVLGAGVAVSRLALSHRTASAPLDAAIAVEAESQMSPNAEATAAYHAGTQALRDASLQTASQQFDRAIQLDPLFAAAHLRRALIDYEEITAGMREDLQSARNSRVSLGDRDRVLLDAMEPWTWTPPDLHESARRIEAAIKDHPKIAEFEFQLGWTLHHTYESARASEAFDAVIAQDPTFALAWCMKGREGVNLGDVGGAIKSYEQCLKVSPGGTSCLDDLSRLQANEGKCEDMEGSARRLIAVAPDVPSAYARLGQALFSRGESVDAVRAALHQEWDRVPAGARRRAELREEASLAILSGRFDDADRDFREWATAAASAPDDLSHYVPAYYRILVDLEVGRTADALTVAGDYLRQRSAWLANAFGLEPTILIYAAQLDAGGITRPRFDQLRDEWIVRDQKRVERLGLVSAAYEGTRWASAYALAVTTREEAENALAQQPKSRPLIDAITLRPNVEEPIGRVSFLAGRADEAVAAFTRASSSCAILDPWSAMYSTLAVFDLGQALEARADTDGACGAYRRVIARWGRPNTPSRTATKALARVRALRCAP